MKILFLLFAIVVPTLSFADHWEKEVSYYNGFAGTGDKMRKETIFLVPSQGEKRRVAERILVDSTNELREMWTSERPTENTTSGNKAIWESLSRHTSEHAASRGSQLNDCTMSDDQLSISCPSGLYVKSGSVNDSLRSGPGKETNPAKNNGTRAGKVSEQ